MCVEEGVAFDGGMKGGGVQAEWAGRKRKGGRECYTSQRGDTS